MMECRLDKLAMHYQALGGGEPILMLPGAPLDHRVLVGCMEPIFENRDGWLRIYPDLPGMGRTESVNWIASEDEMLDVILEFIDRVIPGRSFTLVGHSYGGHLARGVIYHRKQTVNGLLLLAPWIKYHWKQRTVPEKATLVQDPALLAQLDPDETEDFEFAAVVQNQRYFNEWLPGIRTYNRQFFAQLLEHPSFSFNVDEHSAQFAKPTLILAGRQDHISGYRDQWDILENYPRATFAVLDRAGHRLQIEQEELFNALVNEWLDRVKEYRERYRMVQHKDKLLAALQKEKESDWDGAHRIVQQIDTFESNSIHAYLHRKEPDESNARYWYGRVGKSYPDISFDEEWQMLFDLVNQD
jgi:pimeloyl-ACP methyl ester carboxylesterase